MKHCRRSAKGHAAVLILLLVSLLALSAAGFASEWSAATTLPKLPANFSRISGPQAVVQMPMEVVDPDPASVRLRYYDTPVELGTTTLDGTPYQTLRLSGEGSTMTPGAPDLPMVSRLIMVSNTGNVELSVLRESYTFSTLSQDVSPVQLSELDAAAPIDMVSEPAAEVYQEDAWYPPVVATISEPAALRDVRFVVVTVYPVQVNPVTREVRVVEDLELLISNIGGTGPSEIVTQPVSLSPEFRRLYRSFDNFEGSSLDELPDLPGKYLIICPNTTAVITQVERLVAWKKRRGQDAYYVTTAVSGSTANAIRTYISGQYTASGGQLEYVCLVGDPDGATGYVLPTETGGQLDNYFGTLTGGPNPDPVPDVAVGRLSCGNETQLTSVVNKTINYESAPYTANADWFTRTWCAAHSSIPSNPSTKDYTRQIMLQHGIATVYWNTYASHVSQTDIINRLTAGISVFNHRMGWIGEIWNSDADAAPVSQMQPFVMSVTCGTGNFTSDGTSEHWLRPASQTPLSPRGAIGCVGMYGSSTHVPYNNILDAGVMYGIYVLDLQTTGMSLVAGKLELYRNYQASEPAQVANFSYWSNLMGDPAVPIWRKYPDQITVTRPTTINRGTNNVALTVVRTNGSVPVEDALVCLLKGTETYSRGYTDASGQINLPCSTATAGYLHVTITKDNIRPYLDSIQVVTTPASLALSSVAVDDDNISGTVGDDNAQLNPGETIDLGIVLTNTGTSTTVTGISGTLTSTSPGIQITQATSTYPNIASGATGSPTTPFRIVVTSVFENEPSVFFLNLTSSVGAQTVRVNLTPRAGDVTYVSSAFAGPGGNLNPGEEGNLTVTFRNSGSRSLVSAAGILRSLDPYIYVTDSVGTFGNVSASANGTNTTNPFHIQISPGAFNGHRTAMELVITDANGFRDSTLFDSTNFTGLTSNFYLTIGTQTTTSPTGPDAYGYYAFDNTETQPPNCGSFYEWIEIQSTGTNLNFNDQGEDADQSTVLTLPFDFTFYGQSFTQITVCTNGWIAFGSYPNIDDFRNYRMGSPIGPPNQIAAYWDDLKCWGTANNCYYQYFPTDNMYIIEWRAQTLWTSVNEFFQIILYDPDFYQSNTGDGKIKVQYQAVNLSQNQDNSGNDNDFASVGIQNADHSIGLDYYYWNAYSPGSASLVAGRSIMYTTDATGQLNASLELTQPQGGEAWFIGQQYFIQWQSTAVAGNVEISVNRNYPAGAWELISSSTLNDGSHPWSVSGPASVNARVRVISILSPDIGDTSAASFSIINPSAQIIYPNGGEYLQSGTTAFLEWTTTGLGPVRVSLNRNYPGGVWEELSGNAGTDLDWFVSGTPTSTARLRVIGLHVPSVGDTSDANFTIGAPPQFQHTPHADIPAGPASFTALITDDSPGVTAKLFYRLVGAANFDSLALVNSAGDEFGATTTALTAGRYEYFLRAIDPQQLVTWEPATGYYSFDVGVIGTNWLIYDDGTAENYNWVDGPFYKWAVKFDPGTYPFTLAAGRFAICPTCLDPTHDPIIFKVYLADGQNGLPGTLVYVDTTGSAGNVIGGLPAGAAWAEVVINNGAQPLTVNGPFYLSVENPVIHPHPVAFAHDTSGTRYNRSYIYDECDNVWRSESIADDVTRPGNRMIRAYGFTLTPPTVVVFRTDEGANVNATLRWTSTGAPFYRIYSASQASGPFGNLVATVPGLPVGQAMTYTDVNAVNLNLRRFYRIVASDTP